MYNEQTPQDYFWRPLRINRFIIMKMVVEASDFLHDKISGKTFLLHVHGFMTEVHCLFSWQIFTHEQQTQMKHSLPEEQFSCLLSQKHHDRGEMQLFGGDGVSCQPRVSLGMHLLCVWQYHTFFFDQVSFHFSFFFFLMKAEWNVRSGIASGLLCSIF